MKQHQRCYKCNSLPEEGAGYLFCPKCGYETVNDWDTKSGKGAAIRHWNKIQKLKQVVDC